MLKGENRVWSFFVAFPRALSPALGKMPLKTALQCILDSTAVYLDFHCSENGNGWLGGEERLLGMRAFLVVFYS